MLFGLFFQEANLAKDDSTSSEEAVDVQVLNEELLELEEKFGTENMLRTGLEFQALNEDYFEYTYEENGSDYKVKEWIEVDGESTSITTHYYKLNEESNEYEKQDESETIINHETGEGSIYMENDKSFGEFNTNNNIQPSIEYPGG